jgi:hypothetical protein
VIVVISLLDNVPLKEVIDEFESVNDRLNIENRY